MNIINDTNTELTIRIWTKIEMNLSELVEHIISHKEEQFIESDFDEWSIYTNYFDEIGTVKKHSNIEGRNIFCVNYNFIILYDTKNICIKRRIM